MIFFKANSEDPDETPHNVASHLGLRCLTMSHVMYKTIFVINIIIYMCLQHSNVL